jgi:hypothetical protein
MSYDRICLHCAKPFTAASSRALYCSHRCRNTASRWRNRQPAKPRTPAAHGTPAAARAHYRAGEKPCAACRLANNDYKAKDVTGRKLRQEFDPRPVRNGMPEFRPYVYRGRVRDLAEPWPEAS